MPVYKQWKQASYVCHLYKSVCFTTSIMIKKSKIDSCIDLWNSIIPLCGSQKVDLFLLRLWDEFQLFFFKENLVEIYGIMN